MRKIIFAFAALALLATISGGVVLADHPLHGKIIALDAGHGGTECGAQYPANSGCSSQILEKDVNLAVVYALKSKLEAANAFVVLSRVGDETISSRKERVDKAVAKCAALDLDGVVGADNRKCDVLVSVHHNGNVDPAYDGTLTIYTQNSDKPLAQSLLTALTPLTGNSEGMLNGGYGMTVYKNLVSAITEAYYITNDREAAYYLAGSPFVAPDGHTVLVGARTQEEVDAQITGLSNYFASQTGGKGGRPK